MNRTIPDPTERRLVDRFGLAQVLGVSPGRVKSLHDAGRIPAYDAGALRFDIGEVLAALRVPARIDGLAPRIVDERADAATEREDGAA